MANDSFILRAYPKPSVFDETFRTLVESIPPGKFYLLAPFVVPFSPLPQKFIIITDAWESVLKVFVNNREEARFVPLEAGHISTAPDDPHGFHMEVELPLQMDHGENIVRIEIDSGQTIELFVVTSSVVSLLKAYSSTLFQRILYPLQIERESLLSPWSPKAVENLLRFQEDLPDLRIPRTHAIKLIIKAMMAHSGTGRGVQDFATALTYNNPFIRNVSNEDFLKLDFHLSLRQDTLTGSDFHTWIPSKDVARWLAFIRLTQNLPDVFKITDMGFAEVIIEAEGSVKRLEQHNFTQSRIGPDFFEIIRELPRLKLGLHPQKRITRCFGSYYYRYGFSRKVLYPMGQHIFGRRPRHMGPIEAEIELSGTSTLTLSPELKPLAIVADDWGVSPSTSTKVNAVISVDDQDVTYISHNKGGGATETFRFDVSSIPQEAIIKEVKLVAVTRGLGANPRISLIATRGMETEVILDSAVPLANYTSLSGLLLVDPLTGVLPTKDQLAVTAFGVRDDSIGSAIVRVTKISLDVKWTLPLHVRVMGADFRMKIESGIPAVTIADNLRSRITSVSDLLHLLAGGTSPVINLQFVPKLDLDGKIIRLELVSAPPGISVVFRSIRGHSFNTNDGVDLWAAFDHPKITTTLTNPDTDFKTPHTFKPEIGFLGHSIMSTRSADGMQLISTDPPSLRPSKYGTLSGFFPLPNPISDCEVPRSVRMPGPQARLLSVSRLEHKPLPYGNEIVSACDEVIIQLGPANPKIKIDEQCVFTSDDVTIEITGPCGTETIFIGG